MSTYYNPGQNVLGHLTKLGTKTHFAKLTHILPLKKAWGYCYKGLFLLSPSPPSSVYCVELKLEYITSTLHRGGRGEGRCLNLTSYCVSVPRVLTRVVDAPSLTVLGTPRVKSVYRITLSKGTVFVLALPLRQLLRACKIQLKYKVFLNKNRARLFFFSSWKEVSKLPTISTRPGCQGEVVNCYVTTVTVANYPFKCHL